MTKTAAMWEYKVGINAIIANFVYRSMWKSQILRIGVPLIATIAKVAS